MRRRSVAAIADDQSSYDFASWFATGDEQDQEMQRWQSTQQERITGSSTWSWDRLRKLNVL
jgi:hypothetical protein